MKETNKEVRERKRRLRDEQKANKQLKKIGLNLRYMKRFVVQLSCGCCHADLYFESEKAIQDAFAKAGLSSFATITDAIGNTVEGIDTFYGFKKDAMETRNVGYLIKQLRK